MTALDRIEGRIKYIESLDFSKMTGDKAAQQVIRMVRKVMSEIRKEEEPAP
jgi:hypothetical protein